jgi:acyl-coenzyme A synthetase/AMP-(fatty) acid ligase
VRTGSIGVPIDGIQVKIVDACGRDAPFEAGQLLIQSPAMMSFYWQDPAATAAALQDDWFHAGDLARRAADGYLWFLGRMKEIIVRGGSNIAPREVDSALADHPAVVESGVISMPDSRLGEPVDAIVHYRPHTHTTLGEIIAFLRQRLADNKVPERMDVAAHRPIVASGRPRSVRTEPDRTRRPF